MKHTVKTTAFLSQAGMIAALYLGLSLILQPLSYGPIQLRAAEALTILPVLTPAAIPGLTVGCLLTNLIGLTTGANTAGAWDILFGAASTLLSAVLTRALRKKAWHGLPVLSALPPVFINAAVIGLELTLTQYAAFSVGLFALSALSIAVGQLVACVGLGLLFFTAVQRLNLPWV